MAIVGEVAVDKVERELRLYQPQCDGDTAPNLGQRAPSEDREGNEVTLTAYYYKEQADVDAVENLDELNWEIAGYEVV